MAFTESRVRKGKLTLKASTDSSPVVFSCQPSAVSIVPDRTAASGEDDLELLCGDVATSGAAASLTANLNITALQDFTNPDGLISYCWEHDGQSVDFVWAPFEATTTGVSGDWTGKCNVGALTIGGEVGARLTSDAEWPITQLKTPTSWGGTFVIGTGP